MFGILVDRFNKFCGDVSPADDVTLVCIPCIASLMQVSDVDFPKTMQIANNNDDDWYWYVEFVGTSLLKINPVPMVISEIHNISEHSVSTNKLSCIMSALYNNVVGYHASKNNVNAIASSENKNTKNIKVANDNYIRIGIKKVEHRGEPALLVRMEDGSKEFTHNELIDCLNNRNDNLFNEELPLVYELNKSSFNRQAGNCLDAIIYQ